MASGAAGGDAAEILSRSEMIRALIYPLGIISLFVPAFAGVSIGLGKASHGICQASTIRNDITLAVVPAGFIGVMVLYAGLVFFVHSYSITMPSSFAAAMPWFAGQVITGMGLFWAAVGLGDISTVATVAAAQQKKFMSSFFLLLVFGEFVGLFSLIIGILLTMQWK